MKRMAGKMVETKRLVMLRAERGFWREGGSEEGADEMTSRESASDKSGDLGFLDAGGLRRTRGEGAGR